MQRAKTTGLIRAPGMILTVVIGFLVAIPEASSRNFEEYEIKAAFLYSFAQFIKRVPKYPGGPISTLNYCTIHEGPVENALKTLIAARQTEDETRRYTLLTDLSGIEQCHFLFQGVDSEKSEPIQLSPDESVVTVGDSPGFVANGGIIEFQRQGARVKVHINLEIARAHGIKISSKLLKLATIYSPDDGEKVDD
jgi:hypothetical protein